MHHAKNRLFTNITRWSLLAFACITISACSSMKNGGAPAPSFSYEEDLKALEDMYQTAAKLSTYKANATAKERNDFVNGRIALYNIRYQRFVRDLGVDKQHLDAGTDGVLIGLNLASAATGAIRAKTNIALAAAGITGGKSTIDKYFYFDKTIPALIATMNSQRKQVLLRILNGVKLDIDQYPFTQALDDLNNYEMAGTLIGAIDAIQLDSSMKNQEADAKLQKLIVPTEAQTQEALSLSDALISLKANTPENLQKINTILSKINGTPANYTDFATASQAISAAFKPGNDQAWRDALTSVGITVKQ